MDNNFNNDFNQDGWQTQPTYNTPQQPLGKNYDTPILVLGIVSALTALLTSCLCCCAPIPIITSIIGIVFTFITTKNGHEWTTMRIIGLILCIVSLLGLLLYFIYIIVLMYSPAGQQYMNEFMDMYNELFSQYSDFYN